jgi:hypothetical protein
MRGRLEWHSGTSKGMSQWWVTKLRTDDECMLSMRAMNGNAFNDEVNDGI